MSDHLQKARAAVADASGLDTRDGRYQDLLVIAQVQAQLAQADALDRIALVLEAMAPTFVVLAAEPEPTERRLRGQPL